jgi:DNA-binding beta-propeller fold protein YncE
MSGDARNPPRVIGMIAATVAVLALTTSMAHADPTRVTSTLPLEQVAKVVLPGSSTRFDYMSIDTNARRLYISHMNGDELLVFDLRRRKVIAQIPAPGVHGVLAVPQLGRVFASATNEREVLTINAHNESIIARAPAGLYPDGIAYDPRERHVFVSDESGGVETVIDARGRRVATIKLGGGAGNVQYDPVSGMVLADVQTRNDIAVIDPRTNRIIRRVSVPGCDNDHGLLIDSSRRLAFVACDGNAMLFTLDLARMQFTGGATVGEDPDVLAFDSTLHRLYVSAESGEVAVFAERGRRLEKLGQAFLASNAHTVAVDPATHLIYFALERSTGGRPQLLILKPA